MSRDEVEVSPELVGLLIMHNGLKKETLPSIRILHDTLLCTVMVTGDNLQTAITVVKDCERIDRIQRVIQHPSAGGNNSGVDSGGPTSSSSLHWSNGCSGIHQRNGDFLINCPIINLIIA